VFHQNLEEEIAVKLYELHYEQAWLSVLYAMKNLDLRASSRSRSVCKNLLGQNYHTCGFNNI